jgi:hypothetical protein
MWPGNSQKVCVRWCVRWVVVVVVVVVVCKHILVLSFVFDQAEQYWSQFNCRGME